MTDHRQELARRRARNRIAVVNQLDQPDTAGAGPGRENAGRENPMRENRPPPHRSTRIAPATLLLLVALLALPAALWLAL